MGIIVDCKQDEDCPQDRYCYDHSGRCVTYTVCSRFNRLESNRSARHPAQCGPCLPGYITRIRSNGEEFELCGRKPKDPLSTMDHSMTVWVVIGTMSSFLILIIFGYILWKVFFKKCYPCKRKIDVEVNTTNTVTVTASAPPEENNPFIHSHREILPSDDNPVIAIDKLVGACPWRTPNWVNNANYGTNRLHEEDFVDIPNQTNNERNNVPRSVVPHIVRNNGEDSPEQLIIRLPESTANRDNNLNAVLQTCLSIYGNNSNTDNSDNNTANNADDDIDDDDDDDGSTNPAPEPTENGNTHGGKKTMLINQMLKNITMNVNVINVNEI